MNRVQWSGVGIGLKVRIPTEAQIRTAVSSALYEARYRQCSEAIRDEMASVDAAVTSADLLEDLAGEKKLARMA